MGCAGLIAGAGGACEHDPEASYRRACARRRCSTVAQQSARHRAHAAVCPPRPSRDALRPTDRVRDRPCQHRDLDRNPEGERSPCHSRRPTTWLRCRPNRFTPARLRPSKPGWMLDPITVSVQYFRPPRPQPGNFLARARVLNSSSAFVSCTAELEDPVGRLVGFAASQWGVRRIDPPPPSAPASIEPADDVDVLDARSAGPPVRRGPCASGHAGSSQRTRIVPNDHGRRPAAPAERCIRAERGGSASMKGVAHVSDASERMVLFLVAHPRPGSDRVVAEHRIDLGRDDLVGAGRVRRGPRTDTPVPAARARRRTRTVVPGQSH